MSFCSNAPRQSTKDLAAGPQPDAKLALLWQVVTPEEAETMQRQGDLLLSEQACGHMYGLTKAAVQAVQCQNKVSQQPASHT